MRKKYKLIIWIGLFSALMTALYFGVIADELITASLSPSSISENKVAQIGTLSITCSGDTKSVTLNNFTDYFELTGSGKSYTLAAKKALNYEEPASHIYDLKIGVTDGNDHYEEKTVTVTVLNVDEAAPIANSTTITTNEDTAFSGSVTATDTEEASNPLTYEVVSNVTHGSLTFSKTDSGSYTYTPGPEYSGSDSFTFTASDGTNVSNEATVSITVAVVNDAPKNSVLPVVTGTMHAGNELTTDKGTWTDVDSDITKAAYSYQWQSATAADGAGTADISGATSEKYTVTTADGGKYIRAKVSCTDDGGAKADAYSAWQEILNAAPVISTAKPASLSFLEDGAAKDISLTASDSD
ncbi:MAG: Ig-like domain-containing protein, partial [Oscillospiraceae bacterium]